jgi:hypothetical protein
MSHRQLLNLGRKGKILCVGSGDGSQQVAIMKQGFTNVLSTFHPSKETVLQTYPNAWKNIDFLSAHGDVRFQTDATEIHRIFPHNHMELVSFAFPHNGKSLRDCGKEEVRASHKELINRFLWSGSHTIAPDGLISVVLKKTPFYQEWHPAKEVLQDCNLVMLPTTPFERLAGHRPSTTHGVCGGRIPKSDKAEVLTFVRADSVGIHFQDLGDEQMSQVYHESTIHQQAA